jgi:hypothetical protein
MDGTERRTRFQERVRVEREFIVPVNRQFGTSAPLAGMTGAAIESWKSRASNVQNSAIVDQIASILLEASRRAELLADNSRDVFVEERRIGADSLSDLRKILDDALVRVVN